MLVSLPCPSDESDRLNNNKMATIDLYTNNKVKLPKAKKSVNFAERDGDMNNTDKKSSVKKKIFTRQEMLNIINDVVKSSQSKRHSSPIKKGNFKLFEPLSRPQKTVSRTDQLSRNPTATISIDTNLRSQTQNAKSRLSIVHNPIISIKPEYVKVTLAGVNIHGCQSKPLPVKSKCGYYEYTYEDPPTNEEETLANSEGTLENLSTYSRQYSNNSNIQIFNKVSIPGSEQRASSSENQNHGENFSKTNSSDNTSTVGQSQHDRRIVKPRRSLNRLPPQEENEARPSFQSHFSDLSEASEYHSLPSYREEDAEDGSADPFRARSELRRSAEDVRVEAVRQRDLFLSSVSQE